MKKFFEPGDLVIISNWAPELNDEKIGMMLEGFEPSSTGHRYLVLTSCGPEWFEEYRIFSVDDDM